MIGVIEVFVVVDVNLGCVIKEGLIEEIVLKINFEVVEEVVC